MNENSLLRLKERRDKLRMMGVKNGAVQKLSRLISKMERPRKHIGPVPQSWFCTEAQLKGGGVGKIRVKVEEKPAHRRRMPVKR